jgi:hypothetical protein
MIDLEEAARSFASYTVRLDLLCLEYSAASEVPPAGVEPQTTSPKDKIKNRLDQCHRDSVVIGALVNQKLTEVMQLVDEPKILLKLINASNRMVVASQKARALIEEHEVKEKAKNAPREPNQTQIAIREFRVRYALERESMRKRPQTPLIKFTAQIQ